jgi:hypothetical protein
MKRLFVLTVLMLMSLLFSQGPTIGLNASGTPLPKLPDGAGLCGPLNDYCEENDTPGTAFGPLEFGAASEAYPDDMEDFYHFDLSLPASVSVNVSDFAPTSSNGSVMLYGPSDGDDTGPEIDSYTQSEHSSMRLGPHGLGPGKYFVRVYTAADYSSDDLYSLAVTAHSTSTFVPLVSYNFPPNRPPDLPYDPAPPDGASIPAANVDLIWTGGDPDGNSVTYDVYLAAEDTTPDNLICSAVTTPFCDPGTLKSGTTYYWQVFATDVHGATTAGPVWHFVTQLAITRFVRWRSHKDEFDDWQRDGVRLNPDGALELDLGTASMGSDPYGSGGYYARDYYNGGTFQFGEARGPIVEVPPGFTEAVASWNADTPPGTWVETQVRARFGDRWSKWYSLGIWDDDNSTVERHSVRNQEDGDARVAVDTLVVTNATNTLNAYQLKLLLFSEDVAAVPAVRNASVTFSETPAVPGSLAPGDPDHWDRVLPVPGCSQMVYPDGGTVWCSPTSTSMVLAYWNQDTGPCEPRVRAAVDGVYDWLYDGHGNWPFNTAYAATHGLEAYVTRFTSLAEVEAWVAAGVPVVVSLAWGYGELPGAPLNSSNGHLLVVVGFDGTGDPVVNDPAAPSDGSVRHTYDRRKFESLWLEHTGGTSYLIYPSHWAVPALTAEDR